jgi:hypothetical protein
MAQREAVAQLARDSAAGKWKDLTDADDAVDRADRQGEAQEIAASRNLRFVRLGKSVIIAHWLKGHGTPEVKTRFARLVADEARTPFLPSDQNDARKLPQPPAGVRTAKTSAGRALSCCTWDQSRPLRSP